MAFIWTQDMEGGTPGNVVTDFDAVDANITRKYHTGGLGGTTQDMRVISALGAKYISRTQPSDWANAPLEFRFKQATSIADHIVLTKDADGGTALAYIYFDADGSVYYKDTIFRDTGATWTTGVDYKLKIVHDLDTDTYCAWLDDVLIIEDKQYINNNTASAVKYLMLYHVTTQTTDYDEFLLGNAINDRVISGTIQDRVETGVVANRAGA